MYQDLYMESEVKTHKRKNKHLVDPGDLVSEKSLQKSYKILGQVWPTIIRKSTESLQNLFDFQGQGLERLLVKNKKDNLQEIDGDCYRYYLLAGQHPLEIYLYAIIQMSPFPKARPIPTLMTPSTQWAEFRGNCWWNISE